MFQRLFALSVLCCTASAFFFELPGLAPARPQQPQCCPPCGGPSYAPPPPPPAYTPYRKRRSTLSGELEASSSDKLCNSPQLQKIMKNVMTEDASDSREAIHKSVVDQLHAEMMVMCSDQAFEFTVSHDSEYCAVTGKNFSCYAFVF